MQTTDPQGPNGTAIGLPTADAGTPAAGTPKRLLNRPARGRPARFVAFAFVLLLASAASAQGPADCPSEVTGSGTVSELTRQARDLLKRGCRAVAKDLAEPLLARAEGEHGPDSLETADALEVLAESRFWVGPRSDEELALARRALRIRQLQAPVDRQALGRSHRIVGSQLMVKLDARRAVEALEHFEQARLLWEQAHGTESLEVAKLLTWFVELVEDWGDEGEVRARQLPWVADLLDAQTAVGRSVRGTLESAGIATLGSEVVAQDAALAIALRSVALARAADERSGTYAGCLNVVGKLLNRRQLYGEALAIVDQALQVRLDVHPAGHPQIARAYHNRGVALMQVGRLGEAQQDLEDSYEMRLALAGGRYMSLVATSLRMLGKLYFLLGDLSAALQHYVEAVPLLKEGYGNHDYYVEGLVSLAEVYEELGQTQKADTHYREALAVLQSMEDAMQTAAVAGKLGTLLTTTGKPEEGEVLLVDARRAQESVEEEVRPMEDYAQTLRGLADLAKAKGDPQGALDLYRASAKALQSYGDPHPALVDTLLVLAEAELDLGEAAAEKTLGLVAEKLPGLGEAAYAAQARHHLLRARLLASNGGAAALQEAAAAANLYARHLAPTIRVLPPDSARRYALANRDSLDLALALLAKAGDVPERVAEVWEAVGRNRGLVVDELEERSAWARQAGTEVQDLLDQLGVARRRLAATQVRTRRIKTVEERRMQLRYADDQLEAAESAFAEKAAPARSGAPRSPLALDDLLGELPEESALVAFVRFDGSGVFGEGGRYGAFVALAGEGRAHFVHLGPADELDARILRWRRVLLELNGNWPQNEASLRREGVKLKQALWDPVARLAGETRRFFVVNDGALFLLPLAALPGDSGSGYLIEEGYELHRLLSERDLAKRWDATSRPQSLLAIGGADFNAGAVADLEPLPPLFERWREAAGSYFREFREFLRDPCRGRGSLYFTRLPEARAEVAEVAALFRAGAGDEAPVEELAAAAATESDFKRLASRYSTLHVATHAFFDLECRGGTTARGLGDLTLKDLLDPAETKGFVPGLAFAGANRPGNPASGEDDGILTLPEIAGLDLSGVSWAVLSACETAIGQVASGEGVLGLARSFRLAGADTLILSLWPVEDQATREWMRELYRARFSRKETTAASVRSASLAVLRERRLAGEPTHPFFWAAFVATGNWR